MHSLPGAPPKKCYVRTHSIAMEIIQAMLQTRVKAHPRLCLGALGIEVPFKRFHWILWRYFPFLLKLLRPSIFFLSLFPFFEVWGKRGRGQREKERESQAGSTLLVWSSTQGLNP